ncbi:MAG: hypothetical protein JOZ97_07270 [Candidatus Eremiobacteraeota bacterium]|nr:hypothetical protein [Candidatus Eremiobacteraeota bacterium]
MDTASPPPTPTPANGLTTALQIVAAPRSALERLRVAPTWGWAFLIAVVLGAVGTFLSVPAALHSVSASLAHQMAANPTYSQMSDSQRHQLLESTLVAVRYGWAFIPFVLLVGGLVQTIILLAFNAIGRGDAGFRTLWAANINIAIPGFGLYLLVGGLIAVIRGPLAYNSSLDSFLAMPSVAWFSTHAGPATIAFLAAFNAFSIWAFALTVAAMIIVARTSVLNAYAASATILVLAALVSMWGGARP